MKRLITTIALALLVVPATFAGEQSFLARVTVYWASGDAGSNRHQCATGRRLQTGDCAVASFAEAKENRSTRCS